MAEKLIPISRRQAESVNSLKETITSAQERLSLIASVLLQGLDEEIEKAGVIGTRFVPAQVSDNACSGECHFLVLEVPEPEPRPVIDDA